MAVLVDLASEFQKRGEPTHMPQEVWVEAAHEVELADSVEELQQLAQRDAGTGKLHDQQLVSDVAWALATLGAHDRELLEWIQEQAIGSAENLRGRTVARIAWCVGHLNAPESEPLLHALGQRAEALVLRHGAQAMRPTHVSQLAWACAVHGTPAAALSAVTLSFDGGAWQQDSAAAIPQKSSEADLSRLHPWLVRTRAASPPQVDSQGCL